MKSRKKKCNLCCRLVCNLCSRSNPYKTNTAPAGNPLGGTFETDADSQFTLDYNMSTTAPWVALGTVNAASGSAATVAWTGLAAGTEYEWYAAVTDGYNTPLGSSTRRFTTNGNAAPSVALTSPMEGASYELPSSVPLAASASDIDGTIAKVEFYQGAIKIGEDTEAPFTFDWAAPVGSYSVTARATDGQGSATSSAAVSITVIDPMPEVTLAATDASAGENGADQALAFTVTRTGSTTASLSVPLTASGSATEGTDYTGFVSPIEIPVGQASATLPLTVLPDALAEGAETVTLSLGASAAFTAGSPASADATIADKPEQGFYFENIADPAKRTPTADADGDRNANVIEYFMGSLPGDAGSSGVLEIPSTDTNAFKVRYPRAKNRTDVSGSLQWTTDLSAWFASGQSNGNHTVTFAETVISPVETDPEIIEVTATITGPGTAPAIFVRLGVQ